ncbi:MAG: hypothetical protein ACYCZZ_01030 [Minisyncoccota bacterium]
MRTVFAVFIFLISIFSFATPTAPEQFARIDDTPLDNRQFSRGEVKRIQDFVKVCRAQAMTTFPDLLTALSAGGDVAKYTLFVINTTCASEALRDNARWIRARY